MAFDDRLGTILLGTWVCSMLYAEVLRYTWFYFKNFPRDSFLLKALVAATVLSDTASLAADCADVYLNSVTHWGDQAFILNQYWPVTLYLSTTGITAALVQSFLTVRYYSLTHNWIFALVTFVFIACALASCEATAITLAMHPAYNDRFKSRIYVIVWSSTTAVADIVISAALIMQLRSMRSSFASTESAIKRLIRQTIQTGTASSAIAICILVSFVVNNASNIESMFVFILGRIYVLTLLLNVNMRTSAHKDVIAMSTDSENRRHARGNPAVSLDGIQIHRTIVRMEEDDDSAKAKPPYDSSVFPLNPQHDSNSNTDHHLATLESIRKGPHSLDS
ncbi:hypothetical protein GYMLUDRAFT_243032 [Collybiopsis luxurians FD-317 M1]|uniref:DUF6534 domain-containing protein n=1 Tax=Collybiopsis luxurians FD-317 M1 TaxID=944289 RepID=A0A0D0CRJ8_9AGAR|nr:hypothetical protein GYMLUDRAFT_243032 [Collybiopsis luxurians FD-317 M1]